MLQSLTIENFAIIEYLAIDFTDGMTVLSGETGAGKSIIIDALSMLCGGRGSSEFIRQGSDRLLVEGLFSFEAQHRELEQVLADFGVTFDSQTESLILRRELTQQGKNTVRVNGQLANVNLLKQLGYYLVDIHGQNEHQALLNRQAHLQQLDQFARPELHELYQQYQVAYNTYQDTRKAWLNSLQDDRQQMQRLNFLEFQLQEIEQAQLVKGEEETLDALSRRMQDAQKINHALEEANQLLSEGEHSALSQLSQVKELLARLTPYNAQYEQLMTQIADNYYQLEEVAHQLALAQSNDTDDQSIDEVEARLSVLGQLKHKYGMTIDELMDYYQTISEEIYQITHRAQYVAQLSTQLATHYQAAKALADHLHQVRQSSVQTLVQQIEQELADLYMAHSRFEVVFAPVEQDEALVSLIPEAVKLTATGYDQVEFYATTNVGEAMKPLIKVASGGELSRFMLALKRVFSLHAPAQVMVFDEIDTGVSGRVAQAIAEKMYQIAHRHQVLCITHLAQVAAIATAQLHIQKNVVAERTHTTVQTLNETERVEAVAQMMSGKVLTPASLEMARELIVLLREYKETV